MRSIAPLSCLGNEIQRRAVRSECRGSGGCAEERRGKGSGGSERRGMNGGRGVWD